MTGNDGRGAREGLPAGIRRAFRLATSGRRRGASPAGDVDDEIAFHLAMKEARLRAAGMSDSDARAAARQRFGDVARVADACRAEDAVRERTQGRAERLGSVWQDARFAVRALRRTPVTAVAALLTLALGIGATTAIFSVVYGVLVRPLPYREPERLVQLWETSTQTPGARNPVSVPNYRDWATGLRTVDATMAYAFNRFTVAGEGAPEQIQGSQLWGDVWRTLGVRPLVGRGIGLADATEYTVVLGEQLWRRRYGADPGIVGRTVRMNGRPYTVVGVMPGSFRFPRADVELWTGYATILADSVWGGQRGRRFQRVIGRLAQGATVAIAAAEVNAVARRLAEQYPDANAGGGATLRLLRDEVVGEIGPALLVLFGAVGCVLLIACANVTHLLLARATARERELAVRAALGAGRGRVVRQLLTESLVLGVLGATLGTLLAYGGVAALGRLSADAVPRLEEVRVDGWALAFAMGVATLTGLLVGLAPAWRAARGNLAVAARESGRGTSRGRRQGRAQRALVSAEVGLSLVLLVGAGLLLRSYQRLRTIDVGVNVGGVATALVVSSMQRYPDEARQRTLFEGVVERVAVLPGVRAVGLCDCLPPESVRQSGSVLIDGADPAAQQPTVEQTRADPGYFAVLGVPVRAGRAFTSADRAGAPLVAVVNETFARRLLTGSGAVAGAIGRKLSFDDTNWMTVVGVVGDVHYAGLAAPVEPAVYYAFAQAPFQGMNLFVRTTGDPLAIMPSVRRAVLSLDAELPLAHVATLESAVLESIAAPRFQTTLLSLFGVLALALAVIGVYGVVAYGVAQRQREMGVRLALGARPGDVLRLVVAHALRPVWIGVALGLAVAAAGARVLTRFVYETSVREPATYAIVAATLVGVAALAAYLPARRAAAADPVIALRSD